MHVLRGLRRKRAARRLSELWRRLRSETDKARPELEGRQLPGQGPCEHPREAPPGRCVSAHAFFGCNQNHTAARSIGYVLRGAMPHPRVSRLTLDTGKRRFAAVI